jgi:ABC-type lipoprotein export system ATPase subunit
MNITQSIGLYKFTILLGKNGAGKSTLLRSIDADATINSKYISPERGGTLKYDAGVEQNIYQNENWLKNSRNKNRLDNFRQQSTAQFRQLEVLILREIEQVPEIRNNHEYGFDSILNNLNELLPKIKLIRADRGFSVQSIDGENISEDTISSGESELIALAIEVLVYSRLNIDNKVLLLDEPDVHLHPDLQQKFIKFVEKTAIEHNIRVVIATHSTAIIGAFSYTQELQIIPISNRNQTDFNSFRNSQVTSEILPVFGVHPLSSVFNKSPVLLLEGDDDKRVVEQIVRSSNGLLSFTPCVVGSINELAGWESWLNSFLPAIYDNPKAFSLRDLDDSDQTEISDNGLVCRMRFNCRAVENILLSNECLETHNLDEKTFLDKLNKWANNYKEHQYVADVLVLINNFNNRRTVKIKNVRSIIVTLLESNKPWEVIVGQCIAKRGHERSDDPNSLYTYLSEKVVLNLLSNID